MPYEPPSGVNATKPSTTTGNNSSNNSQIPGWIAAGLRSGAIASYTNPNTGQTFTGSSLSQPQAQASATATSGGAGGSSGGSANSQTAPSNISSGGGGGYSVTRMPTNMRGAGGSQGVSISQTPAATGTNQIPAWIYSQLSSGQMASWTNPSTGQTWYAPGSFGNEPLYQHVWLNGPGYSGPVQNYQGTPYINAGGNIIPVETTQTTKITNNGKTIYNGSTASAPSLKFSSNGTFEGTMNVPGNAPKAAKFSDYQTFTTPNGTVSLPTSIVNGNLIETGTWAQNTDGSFSFEPAQLQFSNGQNTITLTNPTAQELETYGYPQQQAQQIVSQLGSSGGTITLTAVAPATPTGSPSISSNINANAPTLSQTQLNTIVNSGILTPSMLGELSPTATVNIGGNTYTTAELIALYNSLANNTYSLPTPIWHRSYYFWCSRHK